MVASSSGLDRPYVASGLGALRAALVVAPSPAVEQQTPVHGEAGAIFERAVAQFDIFTTTLKYFGVRLIQADQALADGAAVSIADGAVVLRDGAIITRPSALGRRREVFAVEAALRALDVPILGTIASPGTVDGADVILAGDTAYVGMTHGTNAIGRTMLRDILSASNYKVVEVPLERSVRRLSSVLAFVDDGLAIVAPNRVDQAALPNVRFIETLQGEEYGAGVLVLGARHVLADLRYAPANTVFKKNKITVEAIDLYEFTKIGIGPSALALAISRKA